MGGRYDSCINDEKIFDDSNGGLIDMVMLPEIFLDHPTVSVKVNISGASNRLRQDR